VMRGFNVNADRAMDMVEEEERRKVKVRKLKPSLSIFCV